MTGVPFTDGRETTAWMFIQRIAELYEISGGEEGIAPSMESLAAMVGYVAERCGEEGGHDYPFVYLQDTGCFRAVWRRPEGGRHSVLFRGDGSTMTVDTY